MALGFQRRPSSLHLLRISSQGSYFYGALHCRLDGGGGIGLDTFLKHFSLFRRFESMQTSHSPHRLGRPALDVIRREAAFPPARVRRLPLKERCLDKTISTQAMRQIPVDCPKYRGPGPHHFGTLRWIWRIVLPHETMEKLISPGFAPS